MCQRETGSDAVAATRSDSPLARSEPVPTENSESGEKSSVLRFTAVVFPVCSRRIDG